MYRILRSDGVVLYDTTNPDYYLLTDPRGTFEIGQPGSLQFSLVPQHPYYNGVGVMETYVSAYKDNEEIFYGRIIDINVDKTTGVKQIECAGALQFLEDGELPPIVSEPSQEEGEEEEGGREQGVQMTASAFFSRCISAYNADILNDPKRALTIGTINPSKASEVKTYNISSYTQVKSAIESNLISDYGGYLKIHRGQNNALVIDWLSTYTEPNNSPIRLRENVISQENAISAHDFYTAIRPIGKDNLILPEQIVPLSNDLINAYGRIVHTVNFNDAETVEALRNSAWNYVAELPKGAGHIGTIKIVDMHFLDNTIPYIRMGSTYTNIAGFEGENMVLAGMELNFANPADDTVTMKNGKELEANQKGGTSGRGTLSRAVGGAGGGQQGFKNIWQHISETEDSLTLFAKQININAENLVEMVGTFERYAEENTRTVQIQGASIKAIQGTGVYQNSDAITQVAGVFSSRYYQISGASTAGRNPHAAGWYKLEAYTPTEDDIGTGIELYRSPQAAMSGITVNTQEELQGLIDQGVILYHPVTATEEEPAPGAVYYRKNVGLINGASFSVSDNGVETNVGELLSETYEISQGNVTQISTIEGSALWTQRNHITGVCGEYRIETDIYGNRKLVVVSGGGISVERNGVEFGLYDEEKLTAGVIVGKINDPNNSDVILGTKVNINASQVHVGSTSNVESWMNSTGQDINTLEGLIADKATIGQLNALDAKIDNIDAQYISAAIATLPTLRGIAASFSGNITCAGLIADGIYVKSGGSNINIGNGVKAVKVEPTSGVANQYTLSYQTFSGTWESGGTFNKAASATISSISLTGNHIGNNWQANVTFSESGAEAQSGIINLADAAAYYREGYTEGNFTGPIRITPISGSGVRLDAQATRYKGNGTRLSQALRYPGNGTRLGASGTYYRGNGSRLTPATRYLGDGSTVTGRGTSYSRTFYGQLYSKNTSTNTYSSKGSGAWFLCGSLSTVYAGNGSTVTGRGTSQTVYVGDSSGSYYLRGDSVTAYPTDSSGSNYLRGTAETVYVTNTSSGSYYLRGDSVTSRDVVDAGGMMFYMAGTEGDYYTKS